MTRTLYYTPVAESKPLGKIEVIDVLEKAFGRMPNSVSKADIPTLEIAERFASAEAAPRIRRLIDMVEHGEVGLSVEY